MNEERKALAVAKSALVIARDGYIGQRATGLACLSAFTERAIAKLDEALESIASLPPQQQAEPVRVEMLSETFIAERIAALFGSVPKVAPYYTLVREVERACAEAWGLQINSQGSGG